MPFFKLPRNDISKWKITTNLVDEHLQARFTRVRKRERNLLAMNYEKAFFCVGFSKKFTDYHKIRTSI